VTYELRTKVKTGPILDALRLSTVPREQAARHPQRVPGDWPSRERWKGHSLRLKPRLRTLCWS